MPYRQVISYRMDIEATFTTAIAAQEGLALANANAASLCAGYLFDLFTAVGLAPHADGRMPADIAPGRYTHAVDGHTVRMAVVPLGTERDTPQLARETLTRMVAIGSLMIESVKLAFSILARRCPELGALRILVVKNTGDLYIEQYPSHCITLC